MEEVVSSHSNPLVKQIRALRERKEREKSRLFLVEGIHHVGEAIAAGWKITRLVYAPDLLTSEYAKRLVNEQSRGDVRCTAMTADLFTSIADKENPQGLLAVVQQRQNGLEGIEEEEWEISAALVSPQDPGNVGTILRTLDAIGGGGLFMLDGGVDPYHPSSIRASMGAIFWKPVVQDSFENFVKWVRKKSWKLIGSSAHARTDYRNYQPGKGRIILLLGSEQKGLSEQQMAACEATLSMPMKGRVSSLNLAVAAGILLYSLVETKMNA